MTNQARFTINSLLEGKSALVHITPATPEEGFSGSVSTELQGSKGVGLEIANIAALPDTDDYAQHEFYAAHFTPAEIAYCTKQREAKAAFQTLLAVKRAIIKSGAVAGSPDGERGVEVSFDPDGRPTYPGCLLSISHTDTLAAAVCFWPGGVSSRAPVAGIGGARSNIVTFPLKTRIFAFLVLLSLLVLFALGLWKMVEFIRH
jgi:phosphopantetheinyl transferase (holo-ACP synthase)